MSTVAEEELLTRVEAAAMLKLKPQTLATWSMRGLHLPIVKIGTRSVRYRKSDVEAFIERGRVPASDLPDSATLLDDSIAKSLCILALGVNAGIAVAAAA